MENKKQTFEELFRLIKENTENSINGIIKEEKIIIEASTENDFTATMKKLYRLVREEGFPDMIDDISNDIYAFSNGEREFIYDENSMYELLRDLVNYDLICFNDTEDAISVEDSNNEDIAQLIQPYVNPQMCTTIAQSF